MLFYLFFTKKCYLICSSLRNVILLVFTKKCYFTCTSQRNCILPVFHKEMLFYLFPTNKFYFTCFSQRNYILLVFHKSNGKVTGWGGITTTTTTTTTTMIIIIGPVEPPFTAAGSLRLRGQGGAAVSERWSGPGASVTPEFRPSHDRGPIRINYVNSQ